MWDFIKAWAGSSGGKVARAYPTPTQQVDVTATIAATPNVDLDLSANPLRGLYVGADGDVYVKMLEDTAFFLYKAVKGTYIEGLIIAIGNSSGRQTGSSLALIGVR